MKTIQRLLRMIYNRLSSFVTFIKCTFVVSLLFCVGVAIHYLCVCLPRHLEIKEANTYYQNMGVDYLGLIVAIFAVIITLLITWQIYSTIKAKNDVTSYKKILKSEYNRYRVKLANVTKEKLSSFDRRLSSLENSCELRDTEINELKNELSDKITIIEAHSFMNAANLYINAAEKSEELIKDRIYENAYKSIVDAIYLFYTGHDYSEIRNCIGIATNCLNGIRVVGGIFTEIVYEDSLSKLKTLVSEESRLNTALKERVISIIELQESISFKSTMESVIDYVISVQKKD